MIPFSPGPTVSLATTTATGRVALGTGPKNQVMISTLPGDGVAFINFGSSTVNAAVTNTPILPGAVYVFTIPPGTTHVAAITGSGTATLYATLGQGA